MKRLTFLALVLAAQAGAATAQMAPSAGSAPVIGPVSLEIDHGVVLDAGAAVANNRDDLRLSWVPRGSAWQVDIPAIMTIEGLQTVTVACNVTGYLNINLNFAGGSQDIQGALLGSVEHVFRVDGPFLGHLVIGIPRIARSTDPAVLAVCSVRAGGVRGGLDWRAFEYAPQGGSVVRGGSVVQYVFEAEDSRFWSGPPFRQQVVLSVMGGAAN